MSEEGMVVERKREIIARLERESSHKLFGEFNKVFVSGKIELELDYSHKTCHKSFYQTRIVVTRLSGVEDSIPIIVPEYVISKKDLGQSFAGKWAEVAGEVRTCNCTGTDGLRHLKMFLFVHAINIYNENKELKEESNLNLIYLDGYICKAPIYRITPLGSQITDLIVAVNRPYCNSDYIPCITWNSDARWASKLSVGEHITLFGRFQRKQYFKKYHPDSDEGEYKEAYEVSVGIIQKAKRLIE